MKRFLVFVVICIVTASLGILTYNFLKVDETISVNATVFEVNIGDSIPLEVIRENEKASTTVTVTSLNEDIVKYYAQTDKFYAEQGGKAILKVTSSLSGFADILIQITVGDGSKTSPLFIRDATELSQLGSEERPLDRCYTLTSDIDLASVNNGEWTPIKDVTNPDNGFTGYFTFNGHTISNLKITQYLGANAGLFEKIGTNGYITGLNLVNVNINGAYQTAGAVAGINKGTVEYIVVENETITTADETISKIGGIVGENNRIVARSQVLAANITSLNSSSIIGGIVGLNETLDATYNANLNRVHASASLNGNNIIGGIAGRNIGGTVIFAYTDTYTLDDVTYGTLTSDNSMAVVGGIVGLNEFKTLSSNVNAAVKDTYSVAPISCQAADVGSIIGKNLNKDTASKILNLIYGNYYNAESTTINEGIGTGAYLFDDPKLADGTYNKSLTEMVDTTTYFSYVSQSFADVYWVFTRVWIADGVNLPTLNYSGPYVDYNLNTIQISGNIIGYESLINVSDDMTGTYLIAASFSLAGIPSWTPIGTAENPFNGVILNPDGYVISGLTISSSSTGLQGLFGYIGKDAVIDGIILEDTNILGGTTVGAIAAVNEGIITNCIVRGSSQNNASATAIIRTQSTASPTVIVGGLVGTNLGQIQSSHLTLGAKVMADSASGAIQYYIGGLVGSNEGTGSITDCHVTGYIATSLIKANVGGIVGINSNTISRVYFQGTISGGTAANQDSVVGGIVGLLSSNATLQYSFSGSSSDLTGYNVGGLVGVSYGEVTECYSESIILAVHGSGLAHSVARGNFLNCYSGAYITGYNSSSIKSGFCYYLLQTKTDTAYITNCFSRTIFGENGENYYEVGGSHPRTELAKYNSGFLVKTIYDKEVGGAANRNSLQGTYMSLWNTFPEFTAWLQQNTMECQQTTAQCQGSDSFAAFRDYNWDESKWSFATDSYPTLRNVVVEEV